MKKTHLVSMLTLSLIGMATLVNAVEPQPGFADLTEQAAGEKADIPMVNDMKTAELSPRMKNMRNGLPCDQACQSHQRDFSMKQGPFHHGMMPYCMQRSVHPGRSGFFASIEPTKAADTEKWQDDRLIILEGNIIKQTGRKEFVFKDGSGELALEIPHHAWRGMVTPNDKVRIAANVEKSWGKTEVLALSVEAVDKAKPVKKQ